MYRGGRLRYTTDRYTDWPPKTSRIWGYMGESEVGGTALAIEAGYIRPAK